MKPLKIQRALLSVSDKTGLEDFARKLESYGVEILSTGGTAALLSKAGIKVKDVSAHTGFPEIMDGRVKTLHPKIHGGILARRDEQSHLKAMKDHDIAPIDLVVVNLYPFYETVQSGADYNEVVENIDVGGPAMVRASAKNHEFVTIVTSPDDYQSLMAEMDKANGSISYDLRQKLAAKAYAHTAMYDSNVANWLTSKTGGANKEEGFPAHLLMGGTLQQSLRYGENPHQKASLYTYGSQRPGVSNAKQIQGKELSYNNLNDTDAAFELVAEFTDPAVAIIKHANPCGVATGKDILAAYERALVCDPVSAFGGIVAINRPLDAKSTAKILETFCEVIIAPSVNDDALPLLAKKPNVRVLVTKTMPDPSASYPAIKTLSGGILVQDADTARITEKDLKVVTKRAPSKEEIRDMLFAFTIAKHVKSNAIVYAKESATVGIGAGQMSRVDSSRIAAWKMKQMEEGRNKQEENSSLLHLTSSLSLASDAFFPFADGLISAAEAGVTAVIQPGGSIRDDEVIKAADERGLAMVFTGTRHFRH